METLRNVCIALDKYCIKAVPMFVRIALLQKVDYHAVSVYAIGCVLNLEDVIEGAAKALIYYHAPILDVRREAFADFKARCKTAAIGAVSDRWFIKDDTPGVSKSGRHPKDCKCKRKSLVVHLPHDATTTTILAPSWFFKLLENIVLDIKSGNVILNYDSWPVKSAMKSAVRCPYCRQNARRRMDYFIQVLRSEIKNRVSGVGAHNSFKNTSLNHS
jgi:hypothetical protein